MATQAYRDWDRVGRPWRLARPVAELAELAKAHPDITLLGHIGDEPHLTDATPEDHTPFSIDEWPVEVREYVVTAVDFGGPAEAVGALCQKALREKPSWLKYMIWRGPVGKTGLRDVRHNWRYQEGSGHLKSAHFSIRTDWIDRSIGDYQLTEDQMGWSDQLPLTPWAAKRWPDLKGDITAGGALQAGYSWSRYGTEQNNEILAGQAAIMARLDGQDDGATQSIVRAELQRAAELERAERQSEYDALAGQLRTAMSAEMGAEAGEAAARVFAEIVARGASPPQG